MDGNNDSAAKQVPAVSQVMAAPPAPNATDNGAAFLSLAQTWLENSRLEVESDERKAKMELDLERTVENHSYHVVQMAFGVAGVFIAMAFVLIFSGRESIGADILKVSITAALAFLAGYGAKPKAS